MPLMTDRLPVSLLFLGEPFDRQAVLHTLRHLAMRFGWRFTPDAAHRIIYATVPPPPADVTDRDVVILSSPAVVDYFYASPAPLPLFKEPDGGLLPFPFTAPLPEGSGAWIKSDVVAGAFALMQLWYERRTRAIQQDGWILFEEDWWGQAGLNAPSPLADEWLDRIALASQAAGWPATGGHPAQSFMGRQLTLVLTHDVDYLPGILGRGFPRLARAIYRQVVTRRRPVDAFKILIRYGWRVWRGLPYWTFRRILKEEKRFTGHSSFQVIVAQRHRADPSYRVQRKRIKETLIRLQEKGWEICLHGSYYASRTNGGLENERKLLEGILGTTILGHRQHYLNFHPTQLFEEIEKAGFRYDLSVGYNNCSGPRAGTFYPYRPYHLTSRHPHTFWEIPFMVMDTTLATTYNFSATEGWCHLQNVLPTHGCFGVIWHSEQHDGLLDPGYDELYTRLLEWADAHQARLAAGGELLVDLDSLWNSTLAEPSPT